MTARERVIIAYGARCAYCQHADGPFELDHIHVNGAAHRKAIGIRLEYWLCREYARTGMWPTGIQLLCVPCHDRKSGRRKILMPARQGATALNITLQDDIMGQLTTLAGLPEYHGSKSAVVETALRQFLEGSASVTALDSVHDHISKVQSTFLEHYQDMMQSLTHLTETLRKVEVRLATLEAQHAQHHGELVHAYDGLKRQVVESGNKGFLSKFMS